ncbi:MAG TPA: hypothetical protein PK156_04430 [Polyangium sp.]|nr:hypothetical protein [Polyangium sp.]
MSDAKEMKLVAEIVRNKLQFTIEANDDDVNEEIFVSFTAPPLWDYIKDAAPLSLRMDDTNELTLAGETVKADRSTIAWQKSGLTSTYVFANGYENGSQIKVTATSKTDPNSTWVFISGKPREGGGPISGDPGGGGR